MFNLEIYGIIREMDKKGCKKDGDFVFNLKYKKRKEEWGKIVREKWD